MSLRRSTRIRDMGDAVPPVAPAAPRRPAAAPRRPAAAPRRPAAAPRRADAAVVRRRVAADAAASLRRTAAASGRRAAAPSASVGRQTSGGQGLGQRLLITSRLRHNATRRLNHELNRMMAMPVDGCQVKIAEDDITHLKATILGPTGSPYEGGQFEMDVRFPRRYPFVPPKVVFITKIYHCNVSVNGSICIVESEWLPAMGVEKLLIWIMSVLSDAIPDDAMDQEKANLYKNNREQYDQNARDWTKRYAMPETLPQST